MVFADLLVEGKDYWDAELKSEKSRSDHSYYLYALARYEAFDELIRKPDILIERGLQAQKKLEEDYGER